ncbi:DNA repair protein endonuclease SAE2/CtIP C-terminus-domain-containing protein [Auriculariales sp. MPI-PUGE-AT-0066]|nr:DNA repair protein endonuclease SAE2/CtIP C-terminus-domain-containing protein [Auriculariales sp. MPI-PUGE-AT-0066]
MAAVQMESQQLTTALADMKAQRNNALRRANNAEAALAESKQKALALATGYPKLVRNEELTKLTTPLTGRLTGTGLPTPDTGRVQAHVGPEQRELQIRYDDLLQEKRTFERKYLDLRQKWSTIKDTFMSSPEKPRTQLLQQSSPSRRGERNGTLSGQMAPPHISSSPTLPSSPAPVISILRGQAPPPLIAARKLFNGDAPPTPASHDNVEIVATSDNEEEEWEPSQLLPPTTASECATQAPISSPFLEPSTSSKAPSTPRRNVTFGSTAVRRRETDHLILVADSSPERGGVLETESQTQSETQPSTRASSAPPDSPVRPSKRKASPLPLDDPTPRKEPRLDLPGPSKAHEDVPTLNALFKINKEANHGLDYQFDDVVRNKKQRKCLEGGDCECCSGYYAAVGPMPPRLKPPRWNSESQESVPQGGNDPLDSQVVAAAAIAAHKNEISRHRHDWAATSTPPDYWHIGFPDTQQVADINRRAAVMHAQKLNHAAAEASKPNGKYQKRRRA